jgi:Transglycosylase SLT domain/SPOR domain
MIRGSITSLAIGLAFASAAHAATKPDRTPYAIEVCDLLKKHADTNQLPVNFFTRLIWKESMFDANALSPVGAEGIAQFMPGTAKLRGLVDSFDHRQALPASAEYLSFLVAKFGNVGLAAAAYNMGEEGTSRWLANKRGLPEETEDYVAAITGHNAEDWRNANAALTIPGIGTGDSFSETCLKLVKRELAPPSTRPNTRRAPRKPWGVVVAGGFSEPRTLATFARTKQQFASLLKDELPLVVRTRNLSRGRKKLVRVMIGRNSQSEAQSLCTQLQSQGGACIVARN